MSKPKEATCKVRPVQDWDPAQEKASLQGVARIWVNKDVLIFLTGGVESGRRCWIERTTPSSHEPPQPQAKAGSVSRRQALLAVSPAKGVAPNVVNATAVYREACGLKLGDQVCVKPHEDPAVPAAEVVEAEPVGEAIGNERELAAWEGAMWFRLKRAGHVFPGMRFECNVASFKQEFVVRTVNAETDNVARFDEASTVLRVKNPESALGGTGTGQPTTTKLAVSGIAGMASEEKKLNNFFRGFNTPLLHRGQQRSCAMVVHGGRGTGKTHVLERIASTGWGKVFRIEENDKSSAVEEVFRQARAQRPSVVLIDGLQNLIGKDRPNAGVVAAKLGQQLDALADEAWRTCALPKVVVVASCLDYVSDVPPELQKLGRLARNVALPVPNAEGRLEVLRTMGEPVEPENRDALLASVAQQTHAYNPFDLCRLMENALGALAERVDPDQEGVVAVPSSSSPPSTDEAAPSSPPYVNRPDLEHALRSTRPTAMHDVNLKPPTIHWRDVGGQENLKKALLRMIRLTITTDPAIRRLVPTPPKGLLLYGPPGCSKTLSAQAMATESGFNFFAVKGAELLNMYVGESERAVRRLFERARSASPSIIFFDEIDSIGGNRTGGGGGGGGSKSNGSSSGSGGGSGGGGGSVNMLTTLLTEMDGFEALTGVLVLAATNRPEAMDPALLRPGRFDRIVYVGLPDASAREAIFRMNLDRLRVAPDVDVPELARLADGFSGAEIRQVCIVASDRAVDAWLDRRDDEGGDGGKGSGGRGPESESEETVIRMRDIIDAIGATPRGVTRDMLDGYERWARRFSRQQQQQ